MAYFANETLLSVVARDNEARRTMNILGGGDFNLGSATEDCGEIVLIRGAQTGDPKITFSLSSDALGDLSITPDTGGIALNPKTLEATGDEIAFIISPTINKATSGDYTAILLNVNEVSAPGSANKLLRLGIAGNYNFDVYSNYDVVQTSFDSGNTGATYKIYHASSSPANNDTVGILNFSGDNSVAGEVSYAQVRGMIKDVTSTSEDGVLRLMATEGGTSLKILDLSHATYATGDEAMLTLTPKVNKATSGDYTAIQLNVSETSAPGTNNALMKLGVSANYKFEVYSDGDGWFISNNAGNTGPILTLYHNSASPAVGDYGGTLNLTGNSSTGVERAYGSIFSYITDPTNAAEKSQTYLQAISSGSLTTYAICDGDKNAFNIPNALVYNDTTILSCAAGSAIQPLHAKTRIVGDGGAVVMTATPTLPNGQQGQTVIIQGTNNTNTVTLQDESVLGGSTLEHKDNLSVVLGAGDIIVYTWDATDSKWYEIGRTVKTGFRTAVNDAAHTADATDYIIAYTALTAVRTVALPAVATAGNGREYVIKDESGDAATHNIIINPSGAETIDGNATFLIDGDYGSATIYCNGSAWFVKSSHGL